VSIKVTTEEGGSLIVTKAAMSPAFTPEEAQELADRLRWPAPRAYVVEKPVEPRPVERYHWEDGQD
jgi:hypothetical protein